ncbi:helix-turn-helix domain-containing protein [Novosphingobium pentaromativorans]|uniref:helix-turn-helix domain-containing protein n=1 Tax=Novosphingobium pentaromativorans TaxID=205844 RepID=UPI001362F929|nr:helix-turn-helix transcriptional regulator [Novosphingobium pentaromativorans]
MSYRTGVKGHRRAAARLVAKVHRTIQKAYEKRRKDGLTQTALADCLGVHRSVVNRQLNGRDDISIARVAEYANLLGYDVEFDFVERSTIAGANHTQAIPPVFAQTASSGSTPMYAFGAGQTAARKPVNLEDQVAEVKIAAIEV